MPSPRAEAEPAWLDPVEMRAWRAFLLAHGRVLRALGDELAADHDVQLSDHEVLIHLSEAPGGRLRMRELADKVVLSRSGLTRRIDRMAAAGLVERVRCPGDGRGVEAHITGTGRDVLRAISPSHLGSVRRHFVDRLDREQLAALAELLAAIGGEPAVDPAGCGGVAAEADPAG